MVGNDRRTSWYFATHDPSSSEYAFVRVAPFGALTLICVLLALFVEPAFWVLGSFSVLATLVWWRRWRRGLQDDVEARGRG